MTESQGRVLNLASRDLNLLTSLRALLEEGNVTRAGDRLGIGQSTMSASLARLRAHYGDELLVRVGREFELTPLARLLLTEVQAALPLVESALGIVAAFDPQTSARRFTISTSDFGWLEVNDLLRSLPAIAPAIAVDFSPLPTNPADSAHEILEYDFVFGPPGIGFEGDHLPLFVDTYVCILDAQNPAIEHGTLSWEAFCRLPQAMSSLGQFHRTSVMRRLLKMGFDPRPAVIVHGLLALPQTVSGTQLVAIVPARLAARFGPLTGTVSVAAPFGEVELVEELWWHPSKREDAGHVWLRELLSGSASRSTGTD